MLVGCTLDFDGVGPHGGDTSPGGSSNGGEPSTGGQGGDGRGGEMGGAPTTNTGGASACETAGGTCVPHGTFTGFRVGANDCGAIPAFRGGYIDQGGQFDAAGATCNCGCNPPELLGCAPVSVSFYDEAQCGGAQTQAYSLAEETCVTTPAAAAYSFKIPTTISAVNAGCTSNGLPPTLPPIYFSDPIVGCDVGLSACDDTSTCVPGGVDNICFIGDDTGTCPPGYDVRRTILIEKDFSDTRNCSCACGSVTGTCVPGFDIYSDTGCGNIEPQVIESGCLRDNAFTSFNSVKYRPTVNASCQTTYVAGGGVEPGLPRAICCSQ